MNYPLQQLLDIKEKRVEDAERELHLKKVALEKEEEKLRKCLEKEKQAQDTYDEQLEAFYTDFQQGTNSDKIKQRKDHLKGLLEKVKLEKEHTAKQEKVRDAAAEEKEEAKRILDERRIDLEKLTEHKKAWVRTDLEEKERLHIIEHDELGAMLHGKRGKHRRGKQ